MQLDPISMRQYTAERRKVIEADYRRAKAALGSTEQAEHKDRALERIRQLVGTHAPDPNAALMTIGRLQELLREFSDSANVIAEYESLTEQLRSLDAQTKASQ